MSFNLCFGFAFCLARISFVCLDGWRPCSSWAPFAFVRFFVSFCFYVVNKACRIFGLDAYPSCLRLSVFCLPLSSRAICSICSIFRDISVPCYFPFLFERSEFLIDTSQKKSLHVCRVPCAVCTCCLLYTSDAADE